MDAKAKPKVWVSFPNEGIFYKDVMLAGMNMVRDTRCVYKVDFRFHRPTDSNRNLQIREFLKSDFDWFFSMDYDNPPIRGVNPLDLVFLDKDIIILPTPMWVAGMDDVFQGAFPIAWNGMDQGPNDTWSEHPDREGLQKVDSGGTGCFLLRRCVLEDFKKNRIIPFMREWDEDGVATRGSDFLFFTNARKLGYEVYCHYDYPCMHFKTHDLAEIFKAMVMRDLSTNIEQENINTPEYWDAAWERRPDRVLKYFEHIVKVCEGKTVLDFGCGRGELMKLLQDAGVEVEGVDMSPKAVEVCVAKGLKATVGEKPHGKHDIIVATQVLEHIDDDVSALQSFFEHADTVIYAVPNNCLPPSIEPEHKRVYTVPYVRAITPYLKRIHDFGQNLVVIASKDDSFGEGLK